MFSNSIMVSMKTPTFTTLSSEEPFASRILFRFCSVTRVSDSMVPCWMPPLTGSNATAPEQKMNPFALTAAHSGTPRFRFAFVFGGVLMCTFAPTRVRSQPSPPVLLAFFVAMRASSV